MSTAIDAGPARGGARFEIVNPATGAVIRDVAEDSPVTVARKFARAVRGQKEWARVRIDDRKACVTRFGQLAQERIEDLAATLSGEMGKPITQSRNEVRGLQARIDFFLANVHKVLSEEEAGADADGRLEERISYEPIGVVGNVSAWNYPYFVGSNVFIPALLTGNAVLYKPSEYASLTGLKIAELMQEAGVPADVFQLVLGGGAAGAALLDQPLAGIFFTGSYATGRKIAEAAARRLMRVQLELGGKDPVYVADDVADVAKVAAAVADGAFYCFLKVHTDLPPLARAEATEDLATYRLTRVGLLPFAGDELGEAHATTLQRAFLLELGQLAPFEVVRLAPDDLAEVQSSEPYRRGLYQPRTLLDLAERFRLDGILIGSVIQASVYPPQVLGLELDLVSCETGMVLWTASLHVDASDAAVRRHLDEFQRSQETTEDWEGGVQLTLISPSRFARFAAHAVAREL